MKVKIAVTQFEIKQFSPKENLSKAELFIQRASKAEAQVIVFPEYFVTGPIFGKKAFVDSSGDYRKYFQSLASKFSIDIVAGSIIEGDSHGWFNTTYYIDSMGKIRGVYRKVNLWLPERAYLTPGHEIAVFNTTYGKVGLIICWDLIFPEIFRRMANRGVSIVYCPSYWLREDAGIGLKYDRDAEIKSVGSLCVSRAFENEIILVYSSPAGKMEFAKISNELIGISQITMPFKGAVKRLDHNKEDMFIQEIDTDILRDAEKAYKIRADLKKRVLY